MLNKLFDFLHSDINSTLAGYFGKLVQVLITRNPNIMLDYITANNIDALLAEKIYSRSISEIIIKILTLENQPADQPFHLEARKNLLCRVVGQINSDNPISHYFTGQVLIEFISRNAETNCWKELVSNLISPDLLKVLTDAATGSVVSRVSASISVFKVLISNNIRNEVIKIIKPQSTEEDSTVIEDEEPSEFTKIIVQMFEPLVMNLKKPSETFLGTYGVEVKILGEDRLKIVEFFLFCIKSDIKEILQALIRYRVLPELVNLFFIFENNSMLHSIIEQIVFASINSSLTDEDIIMSILIEGKLLEKLCGGWEHKGYSGHFIKIGRDLLNASDKNEYIRNLLDENDEWKIFHKTVLQKKIDIEKKTLGESDKKSEDNISEEINSEENLKDDVTPNFSSYKDPYESTENFAEIEEDVHNRDDEPLDIGDLAGPAKEPSPEDISPEKKVLQELEKNKEKIEEKHEEKFEVKSDEHHERKDEHHKIQEEKKEKQEEKIEEQEEKIEKQEEKNENLEEKNKEQEEIYERQLEKHEESQEKQEDHKGEHGEGQKIDDDKAIVEPQPDEEPSKIEQEKQPLKTIEVEKLISSVESKEEFIRENKDEIEKKTTNELEDKIHSENNIHIDNSSIYAKEEAKHLDHFVENQEIIKDGRLEASNEENDADYWRFSNQA